MSRSIVNKMRSVSDTFMEKIKMYILCSVTFFSTENRTIYEVMCKNVVEPDRPQKKICTAHALCMLDTDTRSEYVRVVAFPRQQWLRGDASVLRHKDIACLIV